MHLILTIIPLLSGKLHAKMRIRRPDNVRRKVYCYKKRLIFMVLQKSSQCVPWDLVISDSCINTRLGKFQDIILCAVDQHIPQITLKRRF